MKIRFDNRNRKIGKGSSIIYIYIAYSDRILRKTSGTGCLVYPVNISKIMKELITARKGSGVIFIRVILLRGYRKIDVGVIIRFSLVSVIGV